MKTIKGVIIASLVMLAPLSAFAFNITVDPSTLSATSEDFTISSDDCTSSDYGVVVFTPDGTALNETDCSSLPYTQSLDVWNLVSASLPDGTYHIAFFPFDGGQDPTCIGNSYGVAGSYEACSSEYTSTGSFVLSSGSGSPSFSMDTVISNASSTFTTAVGFNWSDVVAFMKSLLLLVIGSGLGLLETLLPYIIALVTISAIVYFLYRAFRFFKA